MMATENKSVVSNSQRYRSVGSISSIRSKISTVHRDSSVLSNGVVYEYYNGEFDSIPNFDQLGEPMKRGLLPNCHIDSFSEMSFLENSHLDPTVAVGDFAVRFQCLLKIPVEGLWTFSTNSNDGSVLYVSGRKVVDNDGLHYAREVTGKLRLKAGLYPMSLGYFHKSGKVMEAIRGGAFLKVEFQCASATWLSYGHEFVQKSFIPNSLMYFDPLDPNLSIKYDPDGRPTYTTTQSKVEEMQDMVQTIKSNCEELENRLENEKGQASMFIEKIQKLNISTIRQNGDNNDDNEDTTREMTTPCIIQFDKHIKDVLKLKEGYFFALGLAYKLSSGKSICLQDAWEAALDQDIHVDNFPMFLADWKEDQQQDHIATCSSLP